jgi:outer membrane PBP1 activator LpoA protein
MTRYYFIVFSLCLPLLEGCAFSTPLQNPQIIQAEALIQNGKNKEAAAIYKELAVAESEQQHQFRLLAADALMKANDFKQCKSYLDKINLSRLNEQQHNHFNLLQAQLNLSLGNAEKGLAQLKTVQTQFFDDQTKVAYYQSLSFAYSLTGDMFQSAQTLLEIMPYLQDKAAQNRHYEAILTALSAWSTTDLSPKQASAASELNSWMALARILKLEPALINEPLLKWKQLYPTHPANSSFLTSYTKNYQRSFGQARIIAVFLPKSGAFAEAANVIRDGFAKAYKWAKQNGQTQAEIRFYDSTKANPAELYQQAVKEGAQLIVGPLDKKEIKALVNGTDLTVPVLALNHVEGLSHPKLYQFGLSPIDDAQACATKARQDNHQNALLLVPKTEQGKRFNTYLSESWKGLGGTIVNVQSYDEKAESFPHLVNALAKLATGADVILLNAYTKPARALATQLLADFTTAGLPVYATSQVYAGDIDENRDEALGGITFCDVPWMFTQAYTGELSKANLQQSWQKVAPSYLRLLPLGIDAYNVIAHLTELKTKPYQGATGKLSLDNQNKIGRELYCAKFVSGIPKPMNFASENSLDILPAVETKTQP